LAVAAARLLTPLSEAEIDQGLERVRWPGRFEVVEGRPPVVLDGAHNGASAVALADTLRGYAAGRPLHLVIGINRDKDARAVLRPLLALADTVWVTQAADNPRALSAGDLGRLCRRLGASRVQTTTDVSVALSEAQAMADLAGGSGVVCVTGSLMLVGQARATLGLPAPERLW
jgi:dihydrofolate synthase/folylpolyglutamate synthase